MPPPWNKSARAGVYASTVRFLTVLAALVFSAALASAQAPSNAKPATVTLPAGPLLPESFGGWKKTADVPPDETDVHTDAWYKEFGQKRTATARYERIDGKQTTLVISARDMIDATGAYAYFTLNRGNLHDCAEGARIGTDCAVGPGVVKFWRGETYVSISASGSDPIHLSELQPLVEMLPKPSGTKGALPVLPGRLPKKGLQNETIRYAVGPETYEALGVPVDGKLIDFSKSPEIITAKYAGATRGLGSLTLIFYPTPQIAGDRERALEAELKTAHPESAIKRVATMVVIAGGAFSHQQAQSLVDKVTPHEDFTFNNPNSYVPPSQSIQATATVLTKIIIFVLVMVLAAAVLGVFTGGIRALYRKARGKPLSSLEDMEIIKLEIGGKPKNKIIS